jgi:beta-alanine--pyruvate transaminase
MTTTAELRVPNSLDAYWMPFTSNRQFKRDPSFMATASGMYYRTPDGKQLLDSMAGMWCVNAGHCHPHIVKAIQAQAATLDYASPFGTGHSLVFEYANRLTALAPGDLDRVFFTNSGSEAIETALKIALAYQRARGEGGRQRLIGRQRSYHGMGFGCLSVSGIGNHRKQFGVLLPGTAHLPHTHDPRNAFSRGQPAHAAERADALEDLVYINDASTIAAVIVEPIAGSTGVLVPPKGYLERLRAICDKHGILLIFDEVVTGFGRLGACFGSETLGVVPDIIACAKGMTNGAVPMGGVLVRRGIYDAMMEAAPAGSAELMHGYTWSGHTLACAAALATLDVHRDEELFARARTLAPVWEDAVHSLKGKPFVTDVRNCGMLAGVEIQAVPGAPGQRVGKIAAHCYENGVLVRAAADTLVLSPPLVVTPDEIGRIVESIADALDHLPAS